ncbi:MAG: DNA polymerase III subunit delta [Verrucomicrobiota bacterium]
MPAPAFSPPVALLCGDDEFAVKQHARQLFQQWCEQIGGLDHEAIDAGAANSGEALRALARLREALQTLPFFGTGKVVWFKDCSFLGTDRTATAQAVAEALASLAADLKAFRWDNVRLLISATEVDKRKTLYKTLEKIGRVEAFTALSFDDKDWAGQAEVFAQRELRARKKEIADEALGEFVAAVGPSFRDLTNELEKLALYVGDRPEITTADVAAVVTRRKHAKAFALGDALGDRNLPRLLRTLDGELWEIRAKIDKNKNVIGLLYGLTAKVRTLLLLKELIGAGLLKPASDYNRFKTQLERVPADALPADKRFNPLAMNPYMLFKALPQTSHYSSAELVRAMELLLACNQRLVSSGLDDAVVLQQTLVQIVGTPAEHSRPRSPAATR